MKEEKNKIYQAYFGSPIGLLKITASQKGISSVSFVKKKIRRGETPDILKKCKKQLDEYFSKKRKTFNLPLDLKGSAWQKKVWKRVQMIPFGKIVSYGNLFSDRRLARPVGVACKSNKIVIIIPCHRVVGKNSLGGYLAGIKRKKWLLDFEKKLKM